MTLAAMFAYIRSETASKMSTQELREKCDRLLRKFCEQEVLVNNEVPDEVTDYILGSFSGYVLPGLETRRQEPRLEQTNFLDRFEKFILAQPKEKVQPKKTREKLPDVSKLEQTVSETISVKKAELDNLKDIYQKVADQGMRTQSKFEDVVFAESLFMDVSDLKVESIRLKSLDLLYKEKRGMSAALIKLKYLINEELYAAQKLISNLEDAEIAYQRVEANEEFQQLLGKYKKLLTKRNLLKMI